MQYKTFEPSLIKPGNFFLVKRKSLVGTCISFVQRLRYDDIYCRWNHCGLITGEDGSIIEAHSSGIRTNNIKDYDKWEHDVKIVDIFSDPLKPVGDDDVKQMVVFAQSCLKESYGFLTIIAIFVSLLTKSKLRFNLTGEQICSGLLSRALERTWYIPQDDPTAVMPATLAYDFKVGGD